LNVNNTLAKVNAALADFGITLCVEDVLMPYVQRGVLIVLFALESGQSRTTAIDP